jgi:hypothetical protein
MTAATEHGAVMLDRLPSPEFGLVKHIGVSRLSAACFSRSKLRSTTVDAAPGAGNPEPWHDVRRGARVGRAMDEAVGRAARLGTQSARCEIVVMASEHVADQLICLYR